MIAAHVPTTNVRNEQFETYEKNETKNSVTDKQKCISLSSAIELLDRPRKLFRCVALLKCRPEMTHLVSRTAHQILYCICHVWQDEARPKDRTKEEKKLEIFVCGAFFSPFGITIIIKPKCCVDDSGQREGERENDRRILL